MIRNSVRPFFKKAFILCLSTTSLSSFAQTQVQQITAENAAQLIQKGPDSIGGIDDWFITNGTLCAIISDVNHESELSTKGGVLIDLGFCGRDDDHYVSQQDLIDGKRSRPVEAQKIETLSDEKSATIKVYSSTDGVSQITNYTLRTDTPTQLHISKKITRNQPNDDNNFNAYSPLNFNYHSLEPFVFSSTDLQQSQGFKHQDFVTRGISAISDASHNADTIITISPKTAQAPISYGWQLKSSKRSNGKDSYDVPRFALADDESNIFLIITDTFYIGSDTRLGWLQLAQYPFLSLDDESALEIEETIYVGTGGDIASITDQLLTDTVDISGRVEEVNSAIHIDLSDGTPLTHIRPSKSGAFSVKLPAGSYVLRHVGTADRNTSQSFSVGKDDVDLGLLSLPGVARLALPQGQAMRLIFVGLNGTPSPNFIDSFTGLSVQDDDGIHTLDRDAQIFLAGTIGDRTEIELAAGKYRVYATKGPEYSLEKTDIEVTSDRRTTLKIKTPIQQINTPNYIASDLHVHSGLSFDNTFSETERVRTFVAEHGEVMVSSEHDLPVDFAPLIKEMGVESKITSIAATEITSLSPTKRLPFTGGHMNVFPFTPKEFEFRKGSKKRSAQ